MHKSENDWHWLAGIFEGEGYAGLRRGAGRRAQERGRSPDHLLVSIAQTNEEMLQEVCRIAGRGRIHKAGPRIKNPKHKPIWTWQVACKNARIFLTDLLPYIRSPHKRDQIRNALEGDRTNREIGRRLMLETLDRCRAARWKKYKEASYAEIS